MDVSALLKSVMGSGSTGLNQALSGQGLGSGLMGGAAAGGLAGLLLSNKKARKMGKKALKYGGVVAVGGIAYKVWQHHKQSGQPTPQAERQAAAPNPPHLDAPGVLPAPPTGSIFDLAQESEATQDDIRLVLLQAMISAAKADGHIDPEERQRIESQISALGVGAEEQQYLVEQLRAPSDPIAIARLSKSEEQAMEIYTASLLAVDIDTPEERRYLDRLADALLISDNIRAELEQETEAFVREHV